MVIQVRPLYCAYHLTSSPGRFFTNA